MDKTDKDTHDFLKEWKEYENKLKEFIKTMDLKFDS